MKTINALLETTDIFKIHPYQIINGKNKISTVISKFLSLIIFIYCFYSFSESLLSYMSYSDYTINDLT
jgi:hypothetical protein